MEARNKNATVVDCETCSNTSSSIDSQCLQLPCIVAKRRAQTWKERRHRRVNERVEELLRTQNEARSGTRCSLLPRASAPEDLRIKWCSCHASCGHLCYYARSVQGLHGPCLTCAGFKGEDCAICLEPLMAQPVVHTQCGHFFHSHCLHARVQAGAKHNMNGEPVQFDFLDCPLCRRSGIEHLPRIRGRPSVKEQLKLKELVVHQKDVLSNARLRFQVCQKCSLPYCSGEDACHAQAEEAKVKLEALCGPCSHDLPAGKPRICPQHGEAAIAWKCRYCCAIASWECFSGTQQVHACQTCHELMELGELYDFDTMQNKLSLEEYGTCPVRRTVYGSRKGRWIRNHQDEGKQMQPQQIKSVEHRLAVVLEQLEQSGSELEKSADLSVNQVRRLHARVESLQTEKEQLQGRARSWAGSAALECPLKGIHPPTGVEYCLGCTLCDPDLLPT